MQNASLNAGEHMLLSVPLDVLEEAGICPESVIQIRAQRGKIVIDVAHDTSGFVCDSDCEICPCDSVCKEGMLTYE